MSPDERSLEERVRAHGEFISDLHALPLQGLRSPLALDSRWGRPEAGAMPPPAAAAEGAALAGVDESIERLLATEPSVGAYVHVDMAGARDAARAQAEHGRGGALAGVPFGVKDVIAVEGMPLGCGSRLFDGRTAAVDAAVVQGLRRAGAVVLGKHVTHELTCGLDEPPTRNPWALDRYPGGSSAGGGASVAVGSCGFALGTDAAGSVRIPAGMTGVVGLKPTWGAVSQQGVCAQASAPSIDHVGILAPSVDVASAVLRAVTGMEPRASRGRLDGIRLGFLTPKTHASLGAGDEALEAVTDSLGILTELGARLTSIALPSLGSAAAAVFTIFPVELAAAHGSTPREQPGAYSPPVRELLELGAAIPATWLELAQRFRRHLIDEVSTAFARHDLHALVTPTTPRAAMPLVELDPGRDLVDLVAYTCPFNLTGQPALSINCGYTADGLPLGLQIVGRPFEDMTVLEIAAAYEHATRGGRRTLALRAGREAIGDRAEPAV